MSGSARSPSTKIFITRRIARATDFSQTNYVLLHEVIAALHGERGAAAAIEGLEHARPVSSVADRLEQLSPGGVFVAIPRRRHDGHLDVARAGRAAAVIVERDVPSPPGVARIRVRDSRRALALLHARIHGCPGARMKIAGVTGTNGKTTTASLIRAALEKLGVKTGLIGTLGIAYGDQYQTQRRTTPIAARLQPLLAEMCSAGVEAVSMEVTSFALRERRADGIPFHLGIFTNLTRDHLDIHGSMDAYRRAKSRIFHALLRAPGGPPRALLCADDESWPALRPPKDRWLFGFSPRADIAITSMVTRGDQTQLELHTPAGRGTLAIDALGRHNALNFAAAAGACLTFDFPLDRVLEALSGALVPPGRLEKIANDAGLAVFVDYAHSEAALDAALRAVRGATRGRLWVVFSCGGRRDAGKRAPMGRVAEELADFVVLTSDNPRTEDPAAIAGEIRGGMSRAPALIELDRARAIDWTIKNAAPGDAILIAGKGHERHQIIGRRSRPFDDRLVAARFLAARAAELR